jgi:uncharacterized membrane protein YphA (DoxX/SURF4 family)
LICHKLAIHERHRIEHNLKAVAERLPLAVHKIVSAQTVPAPTHRLSMQNFPTSYRYVSNWAILGLVCLRVVIGWHFFMEGSTKVREGGFSSVGFLAGAKGPLADGFHGLLPDYDGKLRLDKEGMKSIYQGYAKQAKSVYGFDAEQAKRADAVVAGMSQGLDSIYGQWAQQITEFKGGFERVAANAVDPKKWGVESLSNQREEIETKWRALVKPVFSDIDKLTKAIHQQLTAVATPQQLQRAGGFEFPAVGSGPMSVSFVDKVIPIFDMTVGILLIIGLCTQLAAWLAGVFLASIVLTQFPGWPGSQPTYYQAIEMVGCFVLAFTDAGRYWGLDFLPWAFWRSRKAAASKAPGMGPMTGTKGGTPRPGLSENVTQAGTVAGSAN